MALEYDFIVAIGFVLNAVTALQPLYTVEEKYAHSNFSIYLCCLGKYYFEECKPNVNLCEPRNSWLEPERFGIPA